MPISYDQADPYLSRAGLRHAAFAGLSASLVGIGLARFAYTPLIPALISAHWFSQGQAVYLGAANLAGYLVGAVFGVGLLRFSGAAWALRALMLLTALSLFACELRELGFIWFTFWRLVSGCTGGAIMVLAAPTVLARTPAARRGLVGGAIFTGVGLGIAASGTLVPLLLRAGGLEAAWAGLGGISLLLTLASWSSWPREIQAAARPAPAPLPAASRFPVPAVAVLVEYGLNAVGLVPHMIFLVVFIAHGLDRGLETAAVYWTIFGLAAVAGPLLAGKFADRVGFSTAIRLVFLVQAAAIALPAVTGEPMWLALSSAIAGAFTPGIVPLALGRLHELIASDAARRRAWRNATTAWALGQALAAYGCSYLLERTESYALLFGLGAAALVAALVLDLAAGLGRARP